MNLFLNVFGIALLVLSLASIAFGAFMATHLNTRNPGILFALVWVPAAATAVGVLWRDPVTIVVGLICFLVAGAALLLAGGRRDKRFREDRHESHGEGRDRSSSRTPRKNQKKKAVDKDTHATQTTQENRRDKGHREAAS